LVALTCFCFLLASFKFGPDRLKNLYGLKLLFFDFLGMVFTSILDETVYQPSFLFSFFLRFGFPN